MTHIDASRISPMFPLRQDRPFRALATAATAGLVALSVMLASALPARADKAGDDLAKAIVAAIAVGAVVHALDDKDKDRGKGKDRGQVRAEPAPKAAPEPVHAARRGPVPESCAIEIAGKRRAVTVYPERCLRREGVEARLPRHCAFEARIYGRKDRVYPEDCLRDAGFRIGQDRKRNPWVEREERRRQGNGRPDFPRNDQPRGGWTY